MASLRIETGGGIITLDKSTVESIEYDPGTKSMEIFFKSGRRSQVTGVSAQMHGVCIEAVFGPQPQLPDAKRLVVADPEAN
jgi:hypothetical protein